MSTPNRFMRRLARLSATQAETRLWSKTVAQLAPVARHHGYTGSQRKADLVAWLLADVPNHAS